MLITKQLTCILLVLYCLTAFQLPAQASATTSSRPASFPASLDNAGCISCHSNSQQVMQMPDVDGKMRPLRMIESKRFMQGAHGNITCIECHREIVDSQSQHSKNTIDKPDCATCHENLWNTVKQQNQENSSSHMEVIAQNIDAYRKSLHAIMTESGVMASCDDCHDTHYFNVPARGTAKRSGWHLTIPQVCGEQCHTDILDEYAGSVHGREVLDKRNPQSAVCTDCHTSHDISRTVRDSFLLSVTRKCGSCHQDNFETYRKTYHGQINTLGYTYTAKCYNCHGSHSVLGIDDPASTIHPDNRLETCRACHDGERLNLAEKGYLTFGPHANTGDYENYPQVWIAAKFMYGLLLFVFGFFWIHSLLWWYRECRNRCSPKPQKRIRTGELLITEPRQVHRFGLFWRIGHLLFALSVMLLILTGMAVFYSYTTWAPVVINVLGGPQAAGLIHRVSAVIMLSIFLLHLAGVSINIYHNRNTFRWFGPDSLLPNRKDFKDARDMFKWFFNRGPRPVFDRWTYWEKFDYWAVFWGMTVIGGSGLMLSFPEVTASVFPGWVFNVIMLVHGEEAFLTAVFLFTVHFFNNHFRPDKLPPPDIVMFTGTQSVEEFKRDHRMQYDRLVKNGQLETYLVDAPSKSMSLGSRILGLVLIACGLVLLVFVATGFFSNYPA